ncbi:MAG: hypothetical protein A4E40_01159 [Methanoregulaceae archaeon PtaU1.Bin059]|nr:MAG: hypothetical protein A4E39_00066 [Methanoregulaceae archaeon PtaB.Bin152]OPY39431.1 MAG: hypothetical protein A4E40_01159 [Methanoregulaceae archaeon PtaU1.Bin059]
MSERMVFSSPPSRTCLPSTESESTETGSLAKGLSATAISIAGRSSERSVENRDSPSSLQGTRPRAARTHWSGRRSALKIRASYRVCFSTSAATSLPACTR